jgi:hypothetical protein
MVRKVGGMLRMARRLREFAKKRAGRSTYADALVRAAHDLEEYAANLAAFAA